MSTMNHRYQMSSDDEITSKLAHKTQLIDIEQTILSQKMQMHYHRRGSVDSSSSTLTSSTLTSSTCCSDPNCSSNHDQLKMMCQRWYQIKNEIKETNEEVLARRQKQIDYGKTTHGYELYRKQVPIDERTKDHPQTPNKHLKYSRRAFDGLIKIWRKELHKFDTAGAECSDDKQSDDNYDGDDDDTTDFNSDL